MISSMALEFILGLMDEGMKVIGKTAAIPVASGPKALLASTTKVTKPATAKARAGRSNQRAALSGNGVIVAVKTSFKSQ